MSKLNLSIDASQIAAADQKQQRVKVAVQQGTAIKSQIVAIQGGAAKVTLDVDPKQTASIAVGPENATDEDVFHLQTLTASVAPAQWTGQTALTIPAIVVTPKWWTTWLTWCREFVISGRLVCADGSPVPGAEVRAYDVNFFWWWLSSSQVGSPVITDPAGHFTIKFRWCCGWWPWYWWQLREWRLEPLLLEKINPILKLNPALKFPKPSPVPTLDFAGLSAAPVLTPPVLTTPIRLPVGIVATPIRALPLAGKIDPTVIPTLRDKLLTAVPAVPELQRLRIWPWYPWAPWFDCTPDIIFRATQNCGNGTKVIVSENIFQTRWDIPTNLSVTLVANQDACCVPQPPPPPPGDCVLLSGVCGDPGITVPNIGRTGTTAGYANPGTADHPFSETVSMIGQFGTASQADYYEVEYTPHGTAAWTPLPSSAMLDFNRSYFDATLPIGFQYPPAVPFPVKTFGTKHVYESRHHYEVNHPPANWGSPLTGRAWYQNVNELAYVETANTIVDGTYDFRIVGYRALGGGGIDPGPDESTRKVIDGCGGSADNNLLVLRLDNRTPFAPVAGTVHLPTAEPDCGITHVRIGGVNVGACGFQQLQHGTPLEIEFFATDPDGHLDHYELVAEHGLGATANLLNAAEVGAFTLTATSGGPKGPAYADAITQGATRPTWNGGSMLLHINDASKVFTETCCYLIRLTVWKRNIVNCSYPIYYNQYHYTFTVIV
jgi:hypothetical protein